MQAKWFNFLILLIIFVSASLIWMIFYPGLMNADSIVQYKQALIGSFDDWHPPVMSIIVYYIIHLGGEIGVITFLQMVLGCFGVYYLSKETLKYFNEISIRQLTFFPFIILLLLLSPITPLAYYLVTFIKDTWLAIDFIWISYFGLWLLNKSNQSKNDVFTFCLLLIGMSLATLLRHNSIILFPVFFILIYRILVFRFLKLKSSFKRHSLIVLIGSAPVLIHVLVLTLIYSGFNVEKTKPESQLIAMESLGAIVENAELKNELNYITEHLKHDYKEAYIPGNVAPIMKWGPVKAVDSSFNIHAEKLRDEYFELYTTAPLTILKVKWDGFKLMLFPKYRYWFHPQLDKNSMGFIQNNRFESVRKQLIQFSDTIYTNRVLSLFFGEHFVWVLVNMLFVIFCLFSRTIESNSFLIVLLIPLAYYLSYIIAATGPQFRFMFPASIIVQIIVLSFIFNKVIQKLEKKQ